MSEESQEPLLVSRVALYPSYLHRMCLIPTSTDSRFLLTDSELIQRIEQVRPGQVTIQVMTGATRAHRMVHDIWLRIAVKRE